MAYLLYGIVNMLASPEIDGDLTGVKGQPVSFIEAHGLCAVVSEVDFEEGAPPVAELLAYAHVVESLHRRQAVVPMRYGCFLNGIPAIRNVLKVRQHQYETLLAELDGHVEMGIRILLPEKRRPRRHGETSLCSDALSVTGSEKENPAPETTPLPNEKSASNGRTYLALRKVHYQMQEETSQDRQMLTDLYLQAFSELYIRHRTETDLKNGAVILSLYFLTPKNAVNRFRETFGNMMAKGNDEAMLSGPWPPYNFVTTILGKYEDTTPTQLHPGPP